MWTLQHYVSVNIEGPEENFFDRQQDGDAAAAQAAGGATAEEQQQHEEQQQEHHPIIQELVVHTHLNNDEAAVAVVVMAPMVDDDNEPAPENHPVANKTVVGVDDIFSGWSYSGVCEHRSTVHQDSKQELKFWMSSETEATNLCLFEAFFFKDYIKNTIIPSTNKNLEGTGAIPVHYGKFLRWLGLWLLMLMMIGPQHHQFWVTHPIDAFKGTPLWFGCWMLCKRFYLILGALAFTDKNLPAFPDNFWEV